MKQLRDLKDLTIHDVHPVSVKLHSGFGVSGFGLGGWGLGVGGLEFGRLGLRFRV